MCVLHLQQLSIRTISVGLGDPILHRAVLWLTPECLQQIISCNPLHLSRKLMLRKVKGHKVDKRDSDPLKVVPDFGTRFRCGSSFLTGTSEPHGGVSGARGGGGRWDLPFACFLCWVLGSISEVKGNPMPPKFKTTLASLRPHIYEHGSPFPKWAVPQSPASLSSRLLSFRPWDGNISKGAQALRERIGWNILSHSPWRTTHHCQKVLRM